MTAKFALTKRISCLNLLLVLALLACMDAVAAASRANIDTNQASNNAVNVRVHRHLNVHTTQKNGDSSEDRTFALPRVAVLETLPKSQTLNKILANIKQKFTSNNPKATHKRFTSLNVGASESKIFESAPYQNWAKSVTKAYKKNPEMGEAAMFSTLMAHYGDETLAKLLVEAKQVSTTERIAQRFEAMQLDSWITTEKTADDIYGLLKLNADTGDLGNEDPYSLLLPKLMKRYGEDGLSSTLLKAKSDGSTKSIVTKGDEMFKNPALSTWFSYATLGKEDPYHFLLLKLTGRYDEEGLAHMLVAAKDGKMLFLELKARFGDEKVAQLLVVAARDYKVKIDVRPLVTVQLNYWQQGGKTADDIFNLLKLSEVGDKLFESPMLLTWRAYVANLDPKKTDELIFSVMKKYYDGDILEKMFADAKKRSATTRSMASNLEEEMWRSQGKTADNLFKFLKLDEKGDDLFESPVLGTWVSYINRLNTYEKRPDEFVVINELEKRFVMWISREY
ncbi:hypothetical protein GQ600_7628 [Phytophthora cactorum]|nr:hypothetical protein GQ600_7628 [Phytophthora cactorum]